MTLIKEFLKSLTVNQVLDAAFWLIKQVVKFTLEAACYTGSKYYLVYFTCCMFCQLGKLANKYIANEHIFENTSNN